jgi:hydrogenase maturation protease
MIAYKDKPCLIFAVGNESRGDDALGPLLLRAIADSAEDGLEAFDLLEDFQLQVEHILDMENRRQVLFIDAGQGTPAPYRFYRATPQPGIGHSTHALLPETLLAVYEQVLGRPAPPAYVLCVRGERFELGEGLSSQAQSHYTAALGLVQRLLRRTDTCWESLAD